MSNLPVPVQRVQELLDVRKEALEKALPEGVSIERFSRIALNTFARNPQLHNCEPKSVAFAIMESAQLGLIPDGILGHCYFVPFSGKAQLIVGYRGLIELAHRSGKVVHIAAEVVHENDIFEYEEGTNPSLRHKRAIDGRGKPIAAYAVAHLANTDVPAIAIMSVEEINRVHRASAVWRDHWSEMARKTALRRLAKYLPLSPEFVQAAVKGEYFDAGVGNGVDLDKPGRQALPPTFEPPKDVETEEVCPECNGTGEIDLGGRMSPCARCNMPEGELPTDEALRASGFGRES